MDLFFFLLIMLSSFSGTAGAQSAVPEQLIRDFGQHSNLALQEKVFLHTDRSGYLAGETMWFKVYLAEGSEHKPLGISKVVYVEILNKDNEAVAQAKVAMKDGTGIGSFYLPLSMASGNFKLRAYTSWMKNFSPDFFFEKLFPVYNTFLNTDFESEAKKEEAFNLKFFPEGGELVNGIRSKVAFKATDRSGKGQKVSGAIVSSGGDTVALLDPLKFGMGHFWLEPEQEESYTAVVVAGKDTLSFYLPAAQEQGYVMQVKDSGNDMLEVIVRTGMREENVYLFVHTRQMEKFSGAGRIKDGSTVFMVDKNSLGEGVSHFTIFNGAKVPVAERLYFKQPKEILLINAETDEKQYTFRQKVSVKLQLPAITEGEDRANLSLAVYRKDSLNNSLPENIISYLWLSSDLTGIIENPSWYFGNVNRETSEALDNLMLTQGWRRFRWKEIIDSESPAFGFIPEYEGHLIQAVVTDKDSGAPVEGVRTFLSAPGKSVEFYASNSNSKGELTFVTEHLSGGKSLILQNYQEKRNVNINLKNPFSEKYSDSVTPSLITRESMSEQLRLQHINMQVQNTYWKDLRNQLLQPQKDSSAFFGEADKTYLTDNFTRFPVMEDVMREYVYEVRVRKQNGKFKFKVINPALDQFFQENPLVLLDGVMVRDIDKLMAYNPLNIEKIEVVTERFFMGKEIMFDGIVSFTTYKGNMENFPADQEAIKIDYEGLQLQREFYSPEYNAGHHHSTRIPDYRTLLHWEPEIITNAKGEAELSFYTSDLPGKYIINVQGLNREGQAGTETISFDVTEESL